MARSKSEALTPALPAEYAPLLAEIKQRVQVARLKATLAASAELLALYWDIGQLILGRQRREGWGAKVIDRLSADLQKEFPGQRGFSPRNLKYMRAFAEAWPEMVIVHRAGAQTGSKGKAGVIVQQGAAQLPWMHHCLLLDKLATTAHRLWYAAQAVAHGWSRNILALQIDAGLHRRQGQAVTNFEATLPPAQSDLAQGLTKDPYVFGFLALGESANERAVERGLVAHVEQFLLELGAGFALVGRQVHLEAGDQCFYLDLLFYHLKLRCYVVIDMKARQFTPEAAGKMNFYLSAADEQFRQADDQPSIGLILCRNKNRVIAEYALRDLSKPIGVSGYVTTLQDALPSVADLERELVGKRRRGGRP
jgi:predicted nuclease of restriction endonuclease-like (RecB) superfamily